MDTVNQVLALHKDEVFQTAELITFTEEILNGKLYFFVQCGNLLRFSD